MKGESCCMKNKKDYGFNDYFEMALYFLALTCFIYFLFKGNKTKTLQPVLTILVLYSIRILLRKFNLLPLSGLRFSILTFIFVTMFLANEFNFYSYIPHLDKIEHLLSGILLTFIGMSLFKYLSGKEQYLKVSAPTIVLFSFFFSTAMAGLWEVFEFSTDIIFSLNSQNGSLTDTMTDIICGSVGALFTSIYLYYKVHKLSTTAY